LGAVRILMIGLNPVRFCPVTDAADVRDHGPGVGWQGGWSRLVKA
jgi:hypothetical protein